jgi:hypothetical protein
MYHWSFYVSREAIKRKNQHGGGGGANSSSKAFGISFADRPKAKMYLLCLSQAMLN